METLLANALGQDESQLAAAEKRDLLARLLGRLAHEIRNPLSSLDIHVQLLEEDLSSIAPELRNRSGARLEIIHGELHRLKSLVNQFLRLAGPSALELESLDLRKLLVHVCELLRPEAATRQIQITLNMIDELPCILGDSVKLTQALMNLVINAIQAVEHDGQVSVAAFAQEDALMIEVRDSGPGIAPEELPSIFDPFFTTKREGHGLGLWIAQQIVTAHRGKLQALNRPEGGAVFKMVLPRRASPAVS